MPNKPVLRVSEWGRLNLPGPLDNPKERLRILKNGTGGHGAALSLRGTSLYARDLVGVVDVGPAIVEILPKTYTGSNDLDDARTLLGMLVEIALPHTARVVRADVGSHGSTLVETLVAHYARALVRQLEIEGFPRRYEQQAGWEPTLKGRVDFSRLARVGPTSTHLPVVYYPLQTGNPLSKVLVALARELRSVTASAHTRALLTDTLRRLPSHTPAKLTLDLVSRVGVSRLERQWKPFVDLARLLAVRRAANPVSAGSSTPFALLMPLDRLFEATLLKALAASASNAGLQVSGGGSGKHLLRDESGAQLVKLRPDIAVKDSKGDTLALIDAKWKRLQGSAASLSPADAYQIAAYLRRYGLSRGALVYPSTTSLAQVWKDQVWLLDESGGNEHIHLVEVDVARLIQVAVNQSVDQATVQRLRDLLSTLANPTK